MANSSSIFDDSSTGFMILKANVHVSTHISFTLMLISKSILNHQQRKTLLQHFNHIKANPRSHQRFLASTTLAAMCSIKLYKGPKDCKHKWAVIHTPCKFGAGFSNCAAARHCSLPNVVFQASIEDCPWHGLKGDYDFNQSRVVNKIKYHYFSLPRGGSVIGCCVQ